MKSSSQNLGLIGYVNAQGRLVQEPLDLTNPRHRAVLEGFACDCEECRELLRQSRKTALLGARR